MRCAWKTFPPSRVCFAGKGNQRPQDPTGQQNTGEGGFPRWNPSTAVAKLRALEFQQILSLGDGSVQKKRRASSGPARDRSGQAIGAGKERGPRRGRPGLQVGTEAPASPARL